MLGRRSTTAKRGSLSKPVWRLRRHRERGPAHFTTTISAFNNWSGNRQAIRTAESFFCPCVLFSTSPVPSIARQRSRRSFAPLRPYVPYGLRGAVESVIGREVVSTVPSQQTFWSYSTLTFCLSHTSYNDEPYYHTGT